MSLIPVRAALKRHRRLLQHHHRNRQASQFHKSLKTKSCKYMTMLKLQIENDNTKCDAEMFVIAIFQYYFISFLKYAVAKWTRAKCYYKFCVSQLKMDGNLSLNFSVWYRLSTDFQHGNMAWWTYGLIRIYTSIDSLLNWAFHFAFFFGLNA